MDGRSVVNPQSPSATNSRTSPGRSRLVMLMDDAPEVLRRVTGRSRRDAATSAVPLRLWKTLVLGLCAISFLGCHCADRRRLAMSQLQARQLYNQNQMLMSQQGSADLTRQELEQGLAVENQGLKQSLDVAQQRLANLQDANRQLEDRVQAALGSATRPVSNPLSSEANERLKRLRDRYPTFEFDPETGVSRFDAEVLFESGSDEIRAEGLPVLQEFANIIGDGDARHLKVMVVGHTDDRPIGKPHTKSRHPTNWHLSTNRANSVVLALRKMGIEENRLGASGYSMFQPAADNSTAKSRQLNRRVEIFVLSPEASIAGWDPNLSR